MHQLRFATAILDFSRRRGGAERYLVDLCTRMAGEEFEVHVYAERFDEENPGIHFHQVKTISFPKSLRLLSFAMRATKEMEKGNYDVTLGVGNTLRADVLQPHGGVHWAWFWRSLRAYDHPFLWVIKFLGRVLRPKQWTQGYIEDAPYRKNDVCKIVAISDMVKEDMVRWYGVPEERITTLYNGVDVERFHPRNRSFRQEIRGRHEIGDEVVILFVSNNFRMKGLEYLIKAVAHMKRGDRSPVKLLVLGRGRQNFYLRLAGRMGISEEIVLAGTTDEPEKYYGAADLLVLPSFYDACSLTVLEALASGVPVITTSSNGASGILRQGEDGWVVHDPRNVDELTGAIRYFLDEKIRRRAAERGREKAETYSEKVNFDRMREIFREVARS
jgi:UDP-glucose:(heptosyl)LPS alpha-1,3-glucosyltransferase